MREPPPSQRKLRSSVGGVEEYAAYDDQLLPLAAEIGEGSAGELVDLARARLWLDQVTVSRWMWSAWERKLIVELDRYYSRFRVTEPGRRFASRFAKP
jgi:hypothetical protein